MTKRRTTDANTDGTMPLSGHLRELRNRLYVCLAVLIVALLVGLRYSRQLVAWLLDLGRKYGYSFVYIAPEEMLLQYVKTALIVAVCVSVPVVFYEAWAFASPGLKKRESALFRLTMLFGTLFFCGGVYFAYRIMLPFTLYFLAQLGEGSGVEASLTVENYITFLMTQFVVFGVVFELPVVSVLLTSLGIIKAKWLRTGRKPMIVAIFVVAAVITPPDVVSQLLVAVPMLALYELSVVLCTACERIRLKSRQTETT